MSSINMTQGDDAAGKTRLAINDPAICLAPYVWKCIGTGSMATAEATMPGAYFRAVFQNSTSLGVRIDATANRGCPAASRPIVDYSVDGAQFQSVQLSAQDELYTLPLAAGLERAASHRVEFYFRAARLGPDRWASSAVHLRLAGLILDDGGQLQPCPRRPKRAVGFGDSITEGVCAEGLCPYYSNLMMNNARVTWLPLVCGALDCEYGQLGSGGLGILKPMSLPPLTESWHHYDAAVSRLTDGLLLPEPDYVFCCIGTNDFITEDEQRKHMDIATAYTNWLAAVRKACPHTQIFCVTPPLGWHSAEIAAAAAARRQAGDAQVHVVDTAPLSPGYGTKNTATQYAVDGCHPSVYGNAVLAAFVTAQAERISYKRCGPAPVRSDPVSHALNP